MKKSLSLLLTIIAVVIGGAFGRTIVKSMFQRNNTVSIDQILIETSKNINATLPMQVDKETRLDATKAGLGNQITYRYTLVNISSGEFETNKFIDTMRSQLINSYKTNPGMASFRKNQVQMHYHYRDRDGNTVATLVVSPKDF